MIGSYATSRRTSSCDVLGRWRCLGLGLGQDVLYHILLRVDSTPWIHLKLERRSFLSKMRMQQQVQDKMMMASWARVQ